MPKSKSAHLVGDIVKRVLADMFAAPQAKLKLDGATITRRDSDKISEAFEKAIAADNHDNTQGRALAALAVLMAAKESFGFVEISGRGRLCIGVAFKAPEFTAEFDLESALEVMTGDDRTVIVLVANALRKLADEMEARPEGALYKRDKSSVKRKTKRQTRSAK